MNGANVRSDLATRALRMALGCATLLAALPMVAATAIDSTDVTDCVAGKPISMGESVIELGFDRDAFVVGAPTICEWAVQAATAVATYFGRYPVAHEHVVLEATGGTGVDGGTTWPDRDTGDRPYTQIRIGRGATKADLRRDWVMTHEMVHLAVPGVPRNSHWLEEGIATYVEPIARAQAGQLAIEQVWADMLHGMPKGLPAADDRGLDRTPTWGRTYWGGALFCLVADVGIRRATHNRSGLQDALRGVIAAGGNIEQDWSVDKVMETGDRAVGGTPVLAPLYEQMATAPVPVDLDDLWRRLGVVAVGDGVHFDDSAPDAAIRRAITEAPVAH